MGSHAIAAPVKFMWWLIILKYTYLKLMNRTVHQ